MYGYHAGLRDTMTLLALEQDKVTPTNIISWVERPWQSLYSSAGDEHGCFVIAYAATETQ